jgi:hypothetical protein
VDVEGMRGSALEVSRRADWPERDQQERGFWMRREGM